MSNEKDNERLLALIQEAVNLAKNVEPAAAVVLLVLRGSLLEKSGSGNEESLYNLAGAANAIAVSGISKIIDLTMANEVEEVLEDEI